MDQQTQPTNSPYEESNAKSKQFRCPNCGGQQIFDPNLNALRCDSCGQSQKIDEAGGFDSVVEYDLLEGMQKLPERGLGRPTRTLSCQGCGAIISFGVEETAGVCSFCASAQVLELDSHRQTLRPESLVPFSKTKDVAQNHFASWLSGLWFRPNDLKKRASVSKIQGVYIPYWVFDATVDSEWSALAGHYYYTTETYTETVNGQSQTRTRQVRHTRWVPASGQRRDIYDDYLICASKGLPKALADRLDTYSTKSLLPYDPSYLSGFKAEEYQIDLKPAWTQAVHSMESIQTDRCSGDVPGDTQANLRVHNEFSDTRFKHVLLPVWIAAYQYKDKTFQFLVNGQTGEVEGHAPYSVWKITFAVIIALILMSIFVLVAVSQQQGHY
ncbi:MAG: primosomal protein N' (replication factor Y) - superfamily II helicase [Proteobacteria bacterium]|nr:MAG: primosomal protein N' (replication factor Y) - superfamily II helicase [Pseudomonadota bacterium]